MRSKPNFSIHKPPPRLTLTVRGGVTGFSDVDGTFGPPRECFRDSIGFTVRFAD